MEHYEKNINYKDEDIELLTDMRNIAYIGKNNPDAYLLMSCTQGNMQFYFNGKLIQLGNRVNFVCPPNSHITNIMLSPDINLTVLRISTRMVHGLINSEIEQWNKFFYINDYNLTLVTDEHQRQMKYYIDLIESKKNAGSTPYNKEIMRSIIRAILFEILSLNEQNSQVKSDNFVTNRTKYHFTKFLELLSSTSIKHRMVEYYAEQLCISPKYLTVVCRKCSNKSALQLINDMKDEDIRHHLISTDLSIKEIATKVGFDDFSFFCKYVRRRFGCSPTEFRKKNNKRNIIYEGD